MQICVATCNMAEFISIFALPFPGVPGEVQEELCVCVHTCLCTCACLSVEGGKSENLHNKLEKKGVKRNESMKKSGTVLENGKLDCICVFDI